MALVGPLVPQPHLPDGQGPGVPGTEDGEPDDENDEYDNDEDDNDEDDNDDDDNDDDDEGDNDDEEDDWPGVGGEELGVDGEDVGVAAPPPQPGHAAVTELRHPALQPRRGPGLDRIECIIAPFHFKSVQSSHFPHILK